MTAAIAWGTTASAQYTREIVGYTGQPVDDVRTLVAFDNPAINDDGNMVLWAWVAIDTALNDECAGAIDVPLGITTIGNHYATPTQTPTWCGTNDVWLRFTAASSGQHTIYGFFSIGITNSTPAVAIYSGACGSLTQIQANCFNSRTLFNVVAGTTYYIRIGAQTQVGAPQRLTATIDIRDNLPLNIEARPRFYQRGLWLRTDEGAFTQIAREGAATPFDGERTFRSTYFPALGSGDDVVMLAATRGSGAAREITRASIVRSIDGSLEEILRDNPQNVAPLWNTPVPQLNAAGRLAYTTNDGIQLRYGDTVVNATMQAPGAANGVTFQLIDQPVSSAGAPVAFRARLVGTLVTEANNMGIWADVGDGLQLVARAGSPAAGAGEGVVWKDVAIEPAVSADGVIAFHGTLTGPDVTPHNDAGIWIGRPGNLQLVARTGNEAPGTEGAAFRSLNRQLRINLSGNIVVGGSLVGKGIDATNNTGLWMMGGNAAASLLAREGEAASPSLPGVLLDNFFDPVLDDHGNVFVTVRVRGKNAQPSTNEALMVLRGAGRRVIARTGDSVDLPSGETKTVRRIIFGDFGAGAGRSVTNSRREVVYRLAFTDNTEAVVRAADECIADWNADGDVNSNDFFTFLIDFFGGRSDINADGATNSQDFFDFLAAFFTGCE